MKFRKLLRVTRNAIALGRSSEPYRHHYLAGLLEKERPTEGASLAGVIPDAYRDAADRYVLQRLLRHVRYTQLLPELVEHLSSPSTRITVGLPKRLRKVLTEKGVKFSYSSNFLWFFCQLQFASDGVRSAIGLLLRGKPDNCTPRCEAVVCNVQNNTLPHGAFEPESGYDFVSWLWRTEGLGNLASPLRLSDVPSGSFVNDSRLHCSSNTFPSLESWVQWFSFAFDVLRIVAIGAIKWLFGQSWQPVLWRGAIELSYFKHLAHKPDKVYFSCSDYDLRPLWTYAAKEAVMVFYSISSELLWRGQTEPGPAESGFQAMSWSRYLLFDDYQVQWLRNTLLPSRDEPVYQACGPVDFVDGPASIEGITSGHVAVFDLTPFRAPKRASMGLYHECWSAQSSIDFLRDIGGALDATGLIGVFKAKRVHTSSHNRRYLSLLNKLVQQEKIVMVDPVVAARRLIERCGAVIVTPYSSPGVIGQQLNKKVAYYDPTGDLGDYPRLRHGVTVLKGKKQLEKWLSEIPRK